MTTLAPDTAEMFHERSQARRSRNLAAGQPFGDRRYIIVSKQRCFTSIRLPPLEGNRRARSSDSMSDTFFFADEVTMC